MNSILASFVCNHPSVVVCLCLLLDVDTLTLKVKDLAQQYDTIFEQKSNVDTELAQTKSRLSYEIAELKSNLNVYKQQLESKEKVEVNIKHDLQQASKLNEEVRGSYYIVRGLEFEMFREICCLWVSGCN